MNLFDVVVLQPIFNSLLFIYDLVGDFGISIIIFTILVRLLMWPLIKKQLHQTKLMRKVQPELKKIKARTKGNKQLETKLMMELYKERGVKPFSSILVLIIQLPIFIAIYQVINIITNHRGQIEQHLYEATKNIPTVSDLISSSHQFNEKFLGTFDLTQTIYSDNTVHISLIILAALAAGFQFIQTKQIMPDSGSQKKLRDVLKDAAREEKTDQAEIIGIMSSKMALFMPLMLFGFAFYLPGAVVLYYATSSFVAIIQQHFALKEEEEEILEIANQEPIEKKGKNGTVIRIKKAKTAKVVSTPKKSKKSKKRR